MAAVDGGGGGADGSGGGLETLELTPENRRGAFGNARARWGVERAERTDAVGGNENGCGSSLACKMLRRRYHIARD